MGEFSILYHNLVQNAGFRFPDLKYTPTTSLFTCYAAVLLCVGTGDAILRTLVNVYTIEKQRCRDRVINDFLSWSRHLLVHLLFHEVTSLHPPSFQRNDFFTCSTYFFIWGRTPIKMECR